MLAITERIIHIGKPAANVNVNAYERSPLIINFYHRRPYSNTVLYFYICSISQRMETKRKNFVIVPATVRETLPVYKHPYNILPHPV